MSLGRRKKNSAPLSGSSRTRSRESLRWRYPASRSMAMAGSDNWPLLGTAMRSRSVMGCFLGSRIPAWDVGTGRSRVRDDAGTDLEMPVDVFQTEAARQHQNLDVVEELGDLFGGFFVALVFGGHPDFSRFLDDLLADRMHPGVQLGDRPRSCRAGPRLLGQLGEQLFEGLHDLFP